MTMAVLQFLLFRSMWADASFTDRQQRSAGRVRFCRRGFMLRLVEIGSATTNATKRCNQQQLAHANPASLSGHAHRKPFVLWCLSQIAFKLGAAVTLTDWLHRHSATSALLQITNVCSRSLPVLAAWRCREVLRPPLQAQPQ